MTTVKYFIKYVNKGKVFSLDKSNSYAGYHEDQKQAMLQQFNHAKEMHPNLDFYIVCVITTTKVFEDAEQI